MFQHKTQLWKGCLWKVERHIFGVIFSSFDPHMPIRKSSVYYHLWNIYYMPDVLYSLSLILTRTTRKFYFHFCWAAYLWASQLISLILGWHLLSGDPNLHYRVASTHTYHHLVVSFSPFLFFSFLSFFFRGETKR